MDKYITIGKRDFFRQGKTYIMGILNMTPDSFSDGGSYKDLEGALERVRQMIGEGADIIDVGGESTRPGYTKISDSEEIARIVPVIRGIKEHFDIPVSADTYKPAVAAAALAAGADMVNDIWGLKYDPAMAGVIAKSGAVCCLMHNRETADYNDFMGECLKDLRQSVDIALKAGIDPEKIILDPGVGFGKTYMHNLLVLKHLDMFNTLGFPVLLGTSRKSVVGQTLHVPPTERVVGTAVTSAGAVAHGCAFVRVHDIRANYEAIKMAEAVKYAPEPVAQTPEPSGGPAAAAYTVAGVADIADMSGGPAAAAYTVAGAADIADTSGGPAAAAMESAASPRRPAPLWHRVMLGLGANIGDRLGTLTKAIDAIQAAPDVRWVCMSDILETAPYGGVAQEDFLNACACIETSKSPQELLRFLNGIEQDLGRERIIRWGPRTIDLDILLYDDWIVDEENLKIPHIDMQNREFVLKPLAESCRHAQHPGAAQDNS